MFASAARLQKDVFEGLMACFDTRDGRSFLGKRLLLRIDPNGIACSQAMFPKGFQRKGRGGILGRAVGCSSCEALRKRVSD